LGVVVFLITAPTANWSRAVAIALEFCSLLVVIATGRERRAIRRSRATALTILAVLAVLLIAAGVLGPAAAFAIGAVLAIAIPAALVGGVIRLFRTRGVTIQTVAGALAIYLLVGLLFAAVISFTGAVISEPYFVQGTDGTQS